MKTLASIAFSLVLAATTFAQRQLIEIRVRYEGFDPARYPAVVDFNKEHEAGNGLLSGQRAMLETVREVQVPESLDGEQSVPAGVTVQLLAVVKDGKIHLSGQSILRRLLGDDATRAPDAISFATHETFFRGDVEDGKELTVAAGDGPNDKARIILRVRLLDPNGAPAK